MPTDHALLAPSAAKRWMACSPSARLEAQMPCKDTQYTREGTVAHGMAESLLRIALAQGWTGWPEDYPDKFRFAYDAVEGGAAGQIAGRDQQNLLHWTNRAKDEGLDPWEMMQTVSDNYCAIVYEDYLAALTEDPDAVLLVEQRLKLDEYIPEGFGSSDAVIIYGRTLAVYDLKYGKGVKVSAEANPQMRCYAVGALCGPGELYDIMQVRMTIIQPRLRWVSQDSMTADSLMAWARTELRPAALLAFEGKGEPVPGDHCRFCAAAPVCRALCKDVLSVAADQPDKALLGTLELAEALRRLPEVKAWAASLEAYCLDQALQGTSFPGFKVVEGRSVRQISDPEAAMKALADAGFKESGYVRPKELKTITDLERLLTKKGFQELLGQWVVKPQGKPALVEESDPRPAFNSANEDFKDLLNQ